MILELKNSSGVYMPLDLFDDFEILYNHQYEDYDSFGSKRVPYTDRFKIPLTNNNRNLCGLPFDLTYPTKRGVEGRARYHDNTTAFEFVTTLVSQTVNVLQPYIEIVITDKISKAISELSNIKLSEMMSDIVIKIKDNPWCFGDQSGLNSVDKYFLFAYHNFNNKNSMFSYDAMRGLTQLHPTFVLKYFIPKIFNHVGLPVTSQFLTTDYALAPDVKADQLGLTIPCELQTNDQSTISVNHAFAGTKGKRSVHIEDRFTGVPSRMPTTSRLDIVDFMIPSVMNNPLKMYYDKRSDLVYEGTVAQNPWGAQYCSLVDGKLSVRIQKNAGSSFGMHFGLISHSGEDFMATANYITFVNTATPADLDVKLVNATMEQIVTGNFSLTNYYEEAESYDSTNAPVVGKAVYAGIDLDTNSIKYDIILDDDVEVEIDVRANQDLGLCYVLCPPAGVTNVEILYDMVDGYNGGIFHMKAIISEGFIETQMQGNTGGHVDSDYFDIQMLYFDRPAAGANQYPASLTFSFKEYTDVPAGFIVDQTLGIDWINNCNINIGESIKAVNDYTLMDIVKLVMQRYNLQLFSKSDGSIHLDTAENRQSGLPFVTDHLIDESMSASFIETENGILTVEDDNPSFYEDGFNKLDAKVISAERKKEIKLSLGGCIENDKVFKDEYDDYGYDLLLFGGDSNYWGIADRKQVLPSEMKPMFSILKTEQSVLYFPIINCSDSFYLSSSPDEQLDIGFYNTFHNNQYSPNLSVKAVNKVTSGFEMISFMKGDFKTSTNTLFRKTWYNTIMSKMNDNAVSIEFEAYVSEDSLAKLMNFPTIVFRGQDWIFEGLNDFPLSGLNGGITRINMKKLQVWS